MAVSRQESRWKGIKYKIRPTCWEKLEHSQKFSSLVLEESRICPSCCYTGKQSQDGSDVQLAADEDKLVFSRFSRGLCTQVWQAIKQTLSRLLDFLVISNVSELI